MTLEGLKVLVTRPQPQADILCAKIKLAGGVPLCWPLIEIAPPLAEADLPQQLAQLSQCSVAIFMSVAAVEHGLGYVRQHLGAWPAGVAVGAIGAATEQALMTQGLPASITPVRGYTSEALLAEPALQQVQGQVIALFQGEGGRELIAEVLALREAQILPLRVYRRVPTELSAARLLTLWHHGEVGAVTVTSVEIFDHLRNLLVGFPDGWRDTPLVVVSARLAEYVRQAGARQVVLAHGPDDDALIAALINHLHEREVD